MVQAYRIKDWDRCFEVAQSRRSERLSWVAIPNKHDGKSYRRIMRQPNGPAIYAAWILILQVASKCPTRGVLADENGPLDAEDLEDKTDCPASLFRETILLLMTPKVAWLEEIELGSLPCDSEQLPDCSEQNEKSAPTGQDRTGHNKQNIQNRASASPGKDLDWDEIRQKATELLRVIPAKTPNDRKLLIGSCALVASGRMSEDWLRGAAESTANKATGNRAAYFTSALRGRARDLHGVTNLDAMLASVPIPAEVRL